MTQAVCPGLWHPDAAGSPLRPPSMATAQALGGISYPGEREDRENGIAVAGAGPGLLTHGVGRFSALPVSAPFQELGLSISERRAKTKPGQKVADAQPGPGDSVEAILFGTRHSGRPLVVSNLFASSSKKWAAVIPTS